MTEPAAVGGVTITHPDRVVYPIERITKFDTAFLQRTLN